MSSLQQVISTKKAALAEAVENPLEAIANALAALWPDIETANTLLVDQKKNVPYSHLLYVMDVNGRQLSANISHEGADATWCNQDLSQRPFFTNTSLPFKGMILSRAYLSDRSLQSCITAIHAINLGDQLLGFLAADFNITDLPANPLTAVQSNKWQQFRGDPAVRNTLFMQERVNSLMDQHLNELNILMDNLITQHGVFHTKLHYSSGRCSLWLYDDPYHYRIHSVEEIINPEICLAYPQRDYPEDALVPQDQVLLVLEHMKKLRYADETIYLRSGSLNIMNGMVGLTFSCDGSHYVSFAEFLDKNETFWFGIPRKELA
ncbi:MAG: hypothetical protein OEY52_00360 [Gammaproteobacteria bacterium]|nr:hypothetical protein [Gammaproteobacteria bacterium]